MHPVGGGFEIDPEPEGLLLGPYAAMGEEIGKLVESKNIAYGDAFGQSGKILEVLFPDGVPVEKYDDLLFLVRTIDKLFRIASRRMDAFGENPFSDIAGYAILGAVRFENDRKKKEDHAAQKRP